MQETQARLLSLGDVRASVRRLRRRGKRLVGQLRHDARQLVERSGKPMVDPSGLPTSQIALARAYSAGGNHRLMAFIVQENCGPSAIPSPIR